jgi:hypothetical protein
MEKIRPISTQQADENNGTSDSSANISLGDPLSQIELIQL